MEKSAVNNAVITCRTGDGQELRAGVVRLTRFVVAFEIYNAGVVLHLSEVLTDFKIVVQERLIYSGQATVKSTVNTGVMLVCEAGLEDAWSDLDTWIDERSAAKIQEQFKTFFGGWKNVYRVNSEFKMLAADMHTFLTDLRLWVEQVELGIRAAPGVDRLELERKLALEISHGVFPCLDALFQQFEELTGNIDEGQRAGYEAYVRRLIQPLVLSSPFAYRSVRKPLGYAGDYETVNMILRDPHEGGSLFGKVLNRWFIGQPPAQAHRNRVNYLTEKLFQETARIAGRNERPRVFNLGCGPAREVKTFLEQQSVSDCVDVALVDFNNETLAYAQQLLEDTKNRYSRRAHLQFSKKSVYQMLKTKGRSVDGPTGTHYDFIYCAGLFDYLNDQVCKQLLEILYATLNPGGLLLVTNVDTSNPIRNWLGYILEWHLNYRNGRQMQAFASDLPNQDGVRVCADQTGVNVFLEVRRPQL